MSDESTITIRATFQTRAEADLAVEHLVQQHGISRPDIFLRSASDDNTSGTVLSGGDLSHDEDNRGAALAGEIELTADIAEDQVPAVQRSLGEVGAMRVSGR